MKKKIIFFAILFVKIVVFSQEVCDQKIWIQNYIQNLGSNLIDLPLNKAKYLPLDQVLLEKQESYLGFIGKNKKRLIISFDSIIKDKENSLKYLVTGRTKVGDISRKFKGNIYIEEICSFENFSYGVDDWMKGKISDQGFVKGKYLFEEDREFSSTGTFNGVFISRWYLDNEDKLHYDDIEMDSDSYKNNQFIGTWTSYKTQKSKICSWGQWRIPCAGDLDIGAAEFSPNPKYFKYGWENYKP